ncbi:MAG: phenylalanine--tRNA ligase subunit beta [Bacteroidales bacterium]|nr:phenylalanine--tRNA ligase subunit beta [Bacteroidales bacterium]
MKISYNWLKQYISTDLPPEQVGDILTNTGLEVEAVESFQSVKGGLDGVVIGEVLTCSKHPNADKLSVTTVDVGKEEPVQIICGAPNVAAGQKVPVAIAGTTLYPTEEGFTIKKAKIRGELSQGMICAENELGLGSSHDGIMVLDQDTPIGIPASEYFKIESDTVFEIGLTPNRIDGASHLGVARDLAAYLKQDGAVTLNKPSVDGFKTDNNELPISIDIEEKAGCRRYSGLTISGISVKESPAWLQTRLRSIGLSPINNVVDITNFVLHESGQPLHAFDAAHITGQKVIVKTMPEGTLFTTLDEQDRKLLATDLMICNTEEGMCIAGVLGGVKAGVTEETKDIFLESACFDPVYIRKTSKHHVLNTDASFRFERGADPNITVWALKRAAMLIREIAGGSISSDVVDVYPEPVEDFRVEISFANVNRLIGNDIEPDIIQSILESLDISVEQRNNRGMVLRVPPYRVDVQREADIVEEILRIYGFNRVETGAGLQSTLSYSSKPDKEKVINLVSDLLTDNGFYEMKSNSLTSTSYYDREEQRDPEAVRLFNPLSQDLALMRKNLLYGGLEAVAYNINRKLPDLKLYEFGNCYYLDPEAAGEQLLDKFDEELHMGIFLSGKSRPGNWVQETDVSSYYVLKSYVETVLVKLGINPYVLESGGQENPDFSDREVYTCRGDQIVEFGSVAPAVLKEFDIKQEVFAAEFNWDSVLKILANQRILFKQLPRFQAVIRDFSLMLDQEVTFESLRKLAFKTEKKLLKKVTLFDVYEGDKIEKGKKSYALSFTLLNEEKTLTDEQIDKIDKVMEKIARAFEKELGAIVRGME